MIASARMDRRLIALSWWLAGLSGCAALSTSPLSPPHVRSASTFAQDAAAHSENHLSARYKQWLADVRGYWGHKKQRFWSEYQSNELWPEPYTGEATQWIWDALEIQTQNGNVQLTSMWDYHFKPATGELTFMGKQRLQDIVNHSSAVGHTVHVQRTDESEETELRMDAVRDHLAKLTDEQETFEVIESIVSPSVVSGAEASNSIQRMTSPGSGLAAPAGAASIGPAGPAGPTQ